MDSSHLSPDQSLIEGDTLLLLQSDLNLWMQEASEVVGRYKLRGNVLPRLYHGEIVQLNEEREQEHHDACKLILWKKIADNQEICPPEILSFLDTEMLNWRSIQYEQDERVEDRIQEAKGIVQRCKERGWILPSPLDGKTNDESLQSSQQDKDARKLLGWKHEMEKRIPFPGQSPHYNDLQEFVTLCQFLDIELRGWRQHVHMQFGYSDMGSIETSNFARMDLEIARGIYNRYIARGCQMPQIYRDVRSDLHLEQECRDAILLNEWKQALLGGANRKDSYLYCPDDVCLFLDENMPLWREKMEKQQAFNQKAMVFAMGIVERYERRGNVLPVRSKECKNDPNRAQEYRDAAKLNDWKQSLKGHKTKTVCSDEVRAYLDEKMPQWRDVVKETHNDPMAKAMEIVQRYRDRGNVMPREWREHRNDPVRAQEYKDASKLRNWKRALKGNGTHNCPDGVRNFLDNEMPDWRKDIRKKYCHPMVTAREIVERYKLRNNVLPRHFSSNRKDPDRQQEYKDAKKLYDWKQGLKGLRFYRCSPELKAYLDENLPGWNDGVYSKASLQAEADQKKAKSGIENAPVDITVKVPELYNTVTSGADSDAHVPVNIADSNANAAEQEKALAKKRMREVSDDGDLHILQRHAQLLQHHQQQGVDVANERDDDNEMIAEDIQHHMLLPAAKFPRVMETKEV